jgi:hypothetical protein
MDAAAAQTLFTQPSRSSGPVTVVVVEGLAGLLLLRDTDVRVLIAPNQPQRPSRRPVSQLPWTHLLGRCDMRAASAKSPEHTRPVRETEADADWSGINAQQAAAAEAFLGMTAADFAACRYHQANWALIGATAADLVRHGVTDHADIAARVADDDRLCDEDRNRLAWHFADPISWTMARCTSPTANIPPAHYAPPRSSTAPSKADTSPMQRPRPRYRTSRHAHQTTEMFRTSVLANRYGNTRIARCAGRLLARHPRLRRFLRAPRITERQGGQSR